jgi:hypothetical protein
MDARDAQIPSRLLKNGDWLSCPKPAAQARTYEPSMLYSRWARGQQCLSPFFSNLLGV